MFWLATMNPGKKTKRRGRGRRRTLNKWQRLVKSEGGVLGAVAARNRLKRPKRKLNKRRSKVMRRSLRSRPRAMARRSTMARTARRRRSRRLPPRGRGGRFLKRGGSRRRRARKNSWFKQPIRHARASRLGRRRRSRSRRNAVTSVAWNPRKRSHRRRRSYRRNAVVPVAWNPSRRRRSRRSYRRNALLPFSLNPGGAIGSILGRTQEFIDISFWTDTALPSVGGFIGAKMVGGMIYGIVGPTITGAIGAKAEPFVKAATTAIGGATLAWAAGNFLSKKMEQAVWLGTVVSVSHALLKAVLPDNIQSAIGLSGMGDDLSERMKAAVAQRVQAELSGVGTYLTQPDLRSQMAGMGEYVTDVALRRQNGYAGSPGGDLRDYDVTRSETTF